HFGLQLCIDRLELFVQRLHLLLGGGEFLVGGLEFFIGGLHFFVGGAEFFLGGLHLFTGSLQLHADLLVFSFQFRQPGSAAWAHPGPCRCCRFQRRDHVGKNDHHQAPQRLRFFE